MAKHCFVTQSFITVGVAIGVSARLHVSVMGGFVSIKERGYNS
jgi:hypothetical protein